MSDGQSTLAVLILPSLPVFTSSLTLILHVPCGRSSTMMTTSFNLGSSLISLLSCRCCVRYLSRKLSTYSRCTVSKTYPGPCSICSIVSGVQSVLRTGQVDTPRLLPPREGSHSPILIDKIDRPQNFHCNLRYSRD